MAIGRLKLSLLVLVSISFVDTSSAYDKVDEQRFLNEYPAAAERIVKKLAMSAGTIESIPVGMSANQGTRTYEFRRDHGCEKVDVITVITLNDKPRRSSSAFVYCEDEKTFFELTKRPEDDGYLVRSLGNSSSDFANYRASIGNLMTVPLGSAKSLLLSALKTGVIVIEEVAPEPSNPKLMRVRLSIPQKQTDSRHTYTFVLDTDNHWAVVSEERAIGGKYPSVQQMEVEYGPKKVDGFAMPAKVKFSRDGAPDSEYRYVDWKFVSTDRDEFRPSHYDLPDLPLAKKRGIPTFMYVLIALIVTLSILGWYLFEVSSRSSKSA